MSEQGPVTFIASRRVKPGREAEFEEWVKGVSRAALMFPGHLGVNVIRPADHAGHEYVVIFRFDTYEHLVAWEQSDVRREWLALVLPLIEGNTRFERQTGLEYWFTPPNTPLIMPPPRHKQLVVSWLAIFPLSALINLLLAPVLNPLPLLLRSMLVTALLLVVITYVVMPRMTRLFNRWLYPPR